MTVQLRSCSETSQEMPEELELMSRQINTFASFQWCGIVSCVAVAGRDYLCCGSKRRRSIWTATGKRPAAGRATAKSTLPHLRLRAQHSWRCCSLPYSHHDPSQKVLQKTRSGPDCNAAYFPGILHTRETLENVNERYALDMDPRALKCRCKSVCILGLLD